MGSLGKHEGLVPAALLPPIADDSGYTTDLAAHSPLCVLQGITHTGAILRADCEVQEPNLVHCH